MCGSYILFQDKHLHPFFNNILVVFPDESHSNLFVFGWQGLNPFFVPHTNLYQLTVLDNQFESTFAIGIAVVLYISDCKSNNFSLHAHIRAKIFTEGLAFGCWL